MNAHVHLISAPTTDLSLAQQVLYEYGQHSSSATKMPDFLKEFGSLHVSNHDAYTFGLLCDYSAASLYQAQFQSRLSVKSLNHLSYLVVSNFLNDWVQQIENIVKAEADQYLALQFYKNLYGLGLGRFFSVFQTQGKLHAK